MMLGGVGLNPDSASYVSAQAVPRLNVLNWDGGGTVFRSADCGIVPGRPRHKCPVEGLSAVPYAAAVSSITMNLRRRSGGVSVGGERSIRRSRSHTELQVGTPEVLPRLGLQAIAVP